MGKGLIEFGSELQRAEDTMNRLIACSDFLTPTEKKEMYVYVTINSIFLRKGAMNVDFVPIIERGFNLNKVVQLNQLSRDYAADQITIQQLYTQIQQVLQTREKRPYAWLAYILLSSSITLILNGSLLECGLAAIIGLMTSQSYPFFRRYLSNKFIPEFLAAFLGGLLACLFCKFYHLDPTLLYTAAIIPMVPGIVLTNGVQDTFNNYFISGPVMILESLTTLVSITLGITFVQLLPFGIMASGKIAVVTVPLSLQVLGSALCSIAFAYIIFAPKQLFLPIGIAGALTWCVYVFVTSLWQSNLLNTLLSISALSLVSRIFAKHFKAPMTIFFIPSLVALVPGITMFVGLSQFGTGRITTAVRTIIIVITNLLGLSIGSIVGEEIYKLPEKFKKH
ncbi:threonine/serine ThrE exporter family protein [Agrilactobacillus fermenti]|uniref:threonine/serine ThrE exporter family protein n=1 Tax=Agrilactobacillus fermenti TaxID=2586909 RepID=UPI001E5C1F7E|nr:threonine/serine exporter family protein [Agrilactobacillus fermenti]MCD2256114.1 threonine/serine exporter family protein [Agrilactobacillus fermenti]